MTIWPKPPTKTMRTFRFSRPTNVADLRFQGDCHKTTTLKSVDNWSFGCMLICIIQLCCCEILYAQARGEIKLELVEKDNQAPLISRVKILSADGKPQRVRGALFQQGWNLFEGPLTFTGRVGDYTYQAFHGLEFAATQGGFTLDRQSQAHEVLPLPRHANLKSEGWIGGDLLSFVPEEETVRWLVAEDLRLAAVASDQAVAIPPTVANSKAQTNQATHLSYWDARPESGLVLHHWLPPATVPLEFPSARLLVMAKESSPADDQLPIHAEIQALWARDVPIWLASNRIDSIQVLGSHLTIDGQRASQVNPVVETDPQRFRGPRREGRIVEFLYWQILECGLRIPPTAGSGFGKNASPLGYNRVYAYSPGSTLAAWWQAIRDGQSFVTNGPLLRATINGELPGKLFTAPEGQSLELDIALKLTVADPVEYLEVVFNGQTLYRARLDEYAKAGGVIPPLSVNESGWLLVRVVTERDFTYRLAMTAPFYVVIADKPRISRQAVKFFQDWLERAAEKIATAGPAAQTAAIPYVNAAREFWKQRAELANAP